MNPGLTSEQQKCLQEFTGYRSETEKRAKAAVAASKERPTRAQMCDLVAVYSTAELAWLNFAETNMTRCGIPAQVIAQIKSVHARTLDAKRRLCAAGPSGPPEEPLRIIDPPFPKRSPPPAPRWCAQCEQLSDAARGI
jgi:hypothetical protein